MDIKNFNLDLLLKMIEISQRMAETRELGPLLDFAMDEAIKLVGAERGYLILLDQNNVLDFRVRRDNKGLNLANPTDEISHSVLDKVIKTGQPIVLGNTMEDPNFKQAKSVIRLRLRSIMSVPLISRGVTIGALYVENRSIEGQFSQASLGPLALFANQAAVAIENAIFNDDLEAKVAARTVELEKARAELEQRWLAAVEFNRVWSELSSAIAHDLRSPLAVVHGGLSLLHEQNFGPLTSKQETIVTSMQRSLQHTLKLTDDLFDVMKLDMKKLTVYPERVDTTSYLQALYQVGAAMPWAEGVQLGLALEADLPALHFDPTRIQQVIINLLSNALKFTQQGQVTLYAQKAQAGDAVIIGVWDTGVGIAGEDLTTIFERFGQAGDARLRQRGTGLGLAICKELVELHQGRIWVESQLNVGSDFKFTLPISGD